MAAKKRRASPLDEPPTASSSDEEEEEQEEPKHSKPSQQQSKEDEVEEDQSSSEEEDEEEDPDEEEEENQPPVLSQSSAKNPPPPPPTKSQPKPKPSSSDESESGTGSDSDSDEEDDVQPPSSKVKPLASKPMDQNPNSKSKAQTQTETPSSPPPNKSGNKRMAENNNAHANDSKRAKKKATDTAVSAAGSDDEMETEEDVKKSGEDSKKMFQRVWSEEDEITIVKSMSDFLSKTGNDPLKYIAAFYEFVKKSLSFEATLTQLRQKIRRIKEKYAAAQKRRKNGVDPTFAKPRDQKLYELSKKVLGKDSNEVEEKGKSNGRTPKSPPTKNTTSAKKPARTKKAEAVPEASEETESEQVVALKEPVKGESDNEVALSEMFRYDKGVGNPGLNEAVVRRGLEFMDDSKKAAMVAKWKKFRADEFQMFMRRTNMIQEQAALVWEAYQSSNP